jgi:F-box protein 18 (helicase)
MPLTEEQAAVVDSSSPSVVVNAFAGAGKTSTLRAYAEARPNQRVLFVAFNRSVAEEAKGRMPAHVRVKTSHALAWAAVARGWCAAKLQGKFNAWVLLQQNLPHLDGEQGVARADALVRFLNGFCQSRSPTLHDHAQQIDNAELLRLGIARDDFLSLAETVWGRMSDGQDPFPATHDTYFKLWQMSRPRLPYDVILLDEAQDTNPALFDVFVRQEHAVRVLVGDRHQNIYGFRGAMNAMEAFKGEGVGRYALTHSFRFGPKIADVANIILREFKNESLRLIGSGADAGVVGESHEPPSRMKTGMLFRTNAGLFDAAASICLRGGKGIHFLGGFQGYAFDDILDTYHLASGRKSSIKNPFLRGFRNFEALQDYAEQVDDKEIKVRCRVVEKYGHQLPHIYRSIEAAASDDGPLTMTTAHKSKGSEWDQVILADDFPPLCRDGKPNTARHQPKMESVMPASEANLWYVAVTRARKRLKINSALAELLRTTKESSWLDFFKKFV